MPFAVEDLGVLIKYLAKKIDERASASDKLVIDIDEKIEEGWTLNSLVTYYTRKFEEIM